MTMIDNFCSRNELKKNDDNYIVSDDTQVGIEFAFNEMNKANKGAEVCTGVADDSYMLRKAEEHIEKLNCELKEKEAAIMEHVRRWQFYEQIVKNLTTFK